MVHLISRKRRETSKLSCIVDPSGVGIGASQGPEIRKLSPVPKKSVSGLVARHHHRADNLSAIVEAVDNVIKWQKTIVTSEIAQVLACDPRQLSR